VFLCGKEPAPDFFRSRDCYVETILTEEAIVEALHYATLNKQELTEACKDRAEYYNYGNDGKASERTVMYMYDVMEYGGELVT